MSGITEQLSFGDKLISLRTVSSVFLRVVTRVSVSFF